MGANSFIFLDRSFDTDQSKLESMINYYGSVGYNYQVSFFINLFWIFIPQVLLFPEGTDKCPKATERSRVYAEKHNLVHYDYVLHPRTTGFVHIVQTMRQGDFLSGTKTWCKVHVVHATDWYPFCSTALQYRLVVLVIGLRFYTCSLDKVIGCSSHITITHTYQSYIAQYASHQGRGYTASQLINHICFVRYTLCNNNRLRNH